MKLVYRVYIRRVNFHQDQCMKSPWAGISLHHIPMAIIHFLHPITAYYQILQIICSRLVRPHRNSIIILHQIFYHQNLTKSASFLPRHMEQISGHTSIHTNILLIQGLSMTYTEVLRWHILTFITTH